MVFGAKAVSLSPIIASIVGTITFVSSSVSIHFAFSTFSLNSSINLFSIILGMLDIQILPNIQISG